MPPLAKWKKEYKERLTAMTNEVLWGEFMDVSQPDDVDGCFTDRGQWMAEAAELVLRRRLVAIGFMAGDETTD